MDYQEVLRRWLGGDGIRPMARATGLDRKTVGKYVTIALGLGLQPGDPWPGEKVVSDFISRVKHPGRPAKPGSTEDVLLQRRVRIQEWLGQDLLLSKVHELLARDGTVVLYSSLHRFAQKWGDFGKKTSITVRTGGLEIISVGLIFLVAIFAFLFLRLAGRTPWLRTVLLYPTGGGCALALVPVLWRYALLGTSEFPFNALKDTLWSFGWPAFAIEVPLFCAVIFLVQNRRIPVWEDLLLLILIYILHYIWWIGIEIPLVCAFFLARKRRIPVWAGLLVHYAWGPGGFGWSPGSM